MMKQSDLDKIREMRLFIESSISQDVGLGELVEHLLKLRDGLMFEDEVWYHSFTQQVVTLDSASTFEPSNTYEKSQLDQAIQVAGQ